MHESTARHHSLEELNDAYQGLAVPPTDEGTVEMIVVRTSEGERVEAQSATLSAAEGVAGDHWSRGKYADRPETQVTLINSGIIDIISGGRTRWALAGDNLVVDLDVGQDNLPPGQHLALGGAVLEVSDQPHTGCAKFSKRYGPDALRFVNLDRGPQERFRGVYARVVEPGEVKTGDTIRKL